MARRRLDLRFPPTQATKPVAYHLVKDFDLTPNILRAQIQPGQEGRMLLEVTGPKEAIDAAMEFLAEEGITVSKAASDICLDEDKCVVCGLCTAVCRPVEPDCQSFTDPDADRRPQPELPDGDGIQRDDLGGRAEF